MHRVYSTQSQEAFLEGHIAAFEGLGGVPGLQIKDDNLTAAVKRVLIGEGRGRVESDRWVLFCSHYGFDPLYCLRALVLHPRVDRSSMITARMARYSVPARLIGRQVRVSLRASELVVFDGRAPVTRHEWVIARGGESIQLDHYLEVLRHKPGALKGSTALAAARDAGEFTAAHEAFWVESRKVNGDSAGTREPIGVLSCTAP